MSYYIHDPCSEEPLIFFILSKVPNVKNLLKLRKITLGFIKKSHKRVTRRFRIGSNIVGNISSSNSTLSSFYSFLSACLLLLPNANSQLEFFISRLVHCYHQLIDHCFFINGFWQIESFNSSYWPSLIESIIDSATNKNILFTSHLTPMIAPVD